MTKILLVEDEAHIIRIMSLWLNRHGYDILEAANGAEALSVLDRESVDVIISDLNMPVMDGFELVRVVRDERGLQIPYLLLSARCDQEKLAERLKPYNVHLYPKPFAPSRLVAEIQRLLGSPTKEMTSP